MEMTNVLREPCDMAIFGKSPRQKVVKMHLYYNGSPYICDS